MTSSVRDYAILWINGRAVAGSGGVASQGGNVILNAGAHHLDGPEHLPTSDNTDLDATTSAHGLLPKLSGSVGDALRGDGTFGGLDHGGLSGLGDDDHPQYLTQAEADALYDPLGAGVSTTRWVPVMTTSPDILTTDGLAVWVPWVTVEGDAIMAEVPV